MHFNLKIPYLLIPKGAYLFSSLLILTSDEITCYMILIIIFIFVNVTLHLQLSREGIIFHVLIKLQFFNYYWVVKNVWE